MTDENKIKALRDLINTAQSSINSAKKILQWLLWEEDTRDLDFSEDIKWLSDYISEDCQIIEWVFTGEWMLGTDGNMYPVPQNYASKSLLVQWSKLKATIEKSWKIKYKIISEIPYSTLIWVITKVGERYQISTEKKNYNVLVAAITFHKCSIGDTVTIRVPEWKEATYAVIEAIIPKK
jgi:hypothetical protein